jgi:hypothetical protein
MNAFFQWLVVAYAPLHARYALVEESRGGALGNPIEGSPMERSKDPLPLVDLDTLDDGATERFTTRSVETRARKPRRNLIANSSGKGGR